MVSIFRWGVGDAAAYSFLRRWEVTRAFAQSPKSLKLWDFHSFWRGGGNHVHPLSRPENHWKHSDFYSFLRDVRRGGPLPNSENHWKHLEFHSFLERWGITESLRPIRKIFERITTSIFFFRPWALSHEPWAMSHVLATKTIWKTVRNNMWMLPPGKPIDKKKESHLPPTISSRKHDFFFVGVHWTLCTVESRCNLPASDGKLHVRELPIIGHHPGVIDGGINEPNNLIK